MSVIVSSSELQFLLFKWKSFFVLSSVESIEDTLKSYAGITSQLFKYRQCLSMALLICGPTKKLKMIPSPLSLSSLAILVKQAGELHPYMCN